MKTDIQKRYCTWRPIYSNGTVHEDQYTFTIISRWILLRMRNISDKSCRGNQETHFMFNKSPPPKKKNCAVYEIMWKNRDRQATSDNIIWHMCVACWIFKAIQTHIFFTYCFSTAAIVKRMCRNVTLYVHCPLLFAGTVNVSFFALCVSPSKMFHRTLGSSIVWNELWIIQSLML
jgi:hypothetical protein